MKTWFICKVKYQKQEEDGGLKNVSEPYLVDAVSFTDAEARIHEELASMIRGDFYVTSISKTNIVDIFHYDDSDTWHKCKISYVAADDSGKEKKIVNQMLVTAQDVKQAYERIFESLNNMLVSFRITEIIETPIVEIFPYIADEDKEVKVPENFRSLSEVE